MVIKITFNRKKLYLVLKMTLYVIYNHYINQIKWKYSFHLMMYFHDRHFFFLLK